MQKFIFLLFVPIFFSACRSASPIITKKNETLKPKANVISNTLKAEKKVRKEKPVTVEKTIENSEPPAFPLDDEFEVKSNNISSLNDELVALATENIGVKYRTGGTNKAGFDCSGLVYSTYAKLNIKLPRTSNEMSRFGTKIDPKDAKKGDLIFFKTLGNKQINHVGMVVEVNEDEIKFVHASIKLGVIISTTKEGYYKNTFAQVNRVVEAP